MRLKGRNTTGLSTEGAGQRISEERWDGLPGRDDKLAEHDPGSKRGWRQCA